MLQFFGDVNSVLKICVEMTFSWKHVYVWSDHWRFEHRSRQYCEVRTVAGFSQNTKGRIIISALLALPLNDELTESLRGPLCP